jgi:lipopolysaccharide/colanic/teichoic acid biosynthesis glycosyltransferase
VTVVNQADAQVDHGGGSGQPGFKPRADGLGRSETRPENRSDARSDARNDARNETRAAPRLGAPSWNLQSVSAPTATSRDTLKNAVKRAMDVFLSVVALVVTGPIMALLAVLIRFDSPGSALFRQTRIGRDGRPFELVKLRTMHQGDGARATRLGCLLRPMGLDELPQFWNVLKADMSIVGPRPERPHLVAAYQSTLPDYGARHAVRPGITGWAQIHGLRGGSGSIAERLRFDIEYVRTWNPFKDFRILALTVTAVWRDTRRELRL